MAAYIYEITIGERFYIGSSNYSRNRQAEHFNQLAANKHGNAIMQAAFNKYGKTATFKVLEELSPNEDQFAIEQIYLDGAFAMDPGRVRLMNLAPQACGGSHIGINAKFFAVISPEGTYHEGTNLRQFSLKNVGKRLNATDMARLGHKHGWRLATEAEIEAKACIDGSHKRKTNQGLIRKILNTKTGEIYETTSLSELARTLKEPKPRVFASGLSNKSMLKYKHYRNITNL